MKTGIELIAEERQRQIDVEGWTAEHDKLWFNGELALAAACYAVENNKNVDVIVPVGENFTSNAWPWDGWWKPSDDPVRNLVKAGALIAAEIDRINAAKSTDTTDGTDEEQGK